MSIPRDQFPKDWPRVRAAALIAAGTRCTCPGSCGNHKGRCQATERLNVHHADEDRFNSNPHNLIVLCPRCHAREHHRQWRSEKQQALEIEQQQKPLFPWS